MYWGSRYCTDCKYNRDCYMLNTSMFEYVPQRNTCIIAEKTFKEAYNEENKRKEK